MITFERSFNYELIRQIITHERIWPHVSDDFSPPPSEYRPLESDVVWYVLGRDIRPDSPDGRIIGLWVFHPHNAVCWEMHLQVLPWAWGPVGSEAGREVIEWFWEQTICQRIIGIVPASNRLALHFMLKTGMRIFGVNEASFRKDGNLIDQICFGISKPEPVDSESSIRKEELCLGQPSYRQQ